MGEELTNRVTERLRLRRPTERDVPALVAIGSDPQTNLHSPTGPPSLEQSERTVRMAIAHWREYGVGFWAVEHDGQIIGITGVKAGVLRGLPIWNLYYRFTPTAWGKGLAGEAAREALAAAQEHDRARTVVVRTRPTNAAAQRLARRIGLARCSELDSDGFITFTSGWAFAEGSAIEIADRG
ncbi:MAG TPA: GNAT family N-acetyltransferase [Solirubrobacteraceae bacterium]|nr:GNAT family N-acetyltransferase [Solirubrobacteraceae bacterium]